MIIVSFVPKLEIESITLWTSRSDSGSSADVASSKININGFLINALAIAIFYF